MSGRQQTTMEQGRQRKPPGDSRFKLAPSVRNFYIFCFGYCVFIPTMYMIGVFDFVADQGMVSISAYVDLILCTLNVVIPSGAIVFTLILDDG